MEQHEEITIAEYQLTAVSFRDGTWDHDVSQNRAALIAALPRLPGKILDLGCGPGRDLVAFQNLGHDIVALIWVPLTNIQQERAKDNRQGFYLSIALAASYISLCRRSK